MIKCNNCKAYCCRKIGLIDPSLDRGDCVCKHLTKDNKCDIYENRPLICNTDKVYELFFSSIMTRDEYDRINAECCIKLRNEYESIKETSQDKEESNTRPED